MSDIGRNLPQLTPKFIGNISRFGAVVMVALIASHNSNAADETVKLKVKPPNYSMQLTQDEFNLLNRSEMEGLQKYGGSGNFQLEIAKSGATIVWNVTINDSRLLELLGIFLGEHTIKELRDLDLDKIGLTQKVELDAVKSLNEKLQLSKNNPIWESVKVSGSIRQEGSDLLLESPDGVFKITAPGPKAALICKAKDVIVHGYVKAPGELELIDFVEKRANTLELFVMSLCPFAQRAEKNIFEFLASSNVITKPNIEIHYIFSKQFNSAQSTYTSLHGEPEITEDLVQITIRDNFPSFFEAYLQMRATNGRIPWKGITEKIGLNASENGEIEKRISVHRDEIIAKEADYTNNCYGPINTSPTYFWEGDSVPNLNSIKSFKGISLTGNSSCKQ